jgi:hypothetical protein
MDPTEAGGHTPRGRDPVSSEAAGGGYETRDAHVRAIVWFAVGLVVVAGAVHGLMWVMFERFAERERQADPPPRTLTAPAPEPPPEPRLQVLTRPEGTFGFGLAPAESLARLRATEDETLSTYGWIDRPAGIVRIPIERAMTLVVERGLPPPAAREPTPAAAGARER